MKNFCEINSIRRASLKTGIKKALEQIFSKSLESAAREQGLNELADRLQGIVADISQQYSTFKVDSDYLNIKVRNQHAFQISLLEAILQEFKNPVIVDLGDSSGTHLEYIRVFTLKILNA